MKVSSTRCLRCCGFLTKLLKWVCNFSSAFKMLCLISFFYMEQNRCNTLKWDSMFESLKSLLQVFIPKCVFCMKVALWKEESMKRKKYILEVPRSDAKFSQTHCGLQLWEKLFGEQKRNVSQRDARKWKITQGVLGDAFVSSQVPLGFSSCQIILIACNISALFKRLTIS